MNHSPINGLQIRRIRLRPLTDGSMLSCHPHDKRNRMHGKNPLILRRTYDITAACTRQNTDEGDEPLALHIRGERSTPLLRYAVIGAAAIGVAVTAMYLSRVCREWQIRRKYARRYAERLREQRYRMQMREKPGKAAAAEPDAKT